MDPTHEGLQADNDIPVPLRQSSRMMRNQPPWRYYNFALWQNDILPGAFNILVGRCICIHINSCVHIIFMGNTVCSVKALYLSYSRSAQHNQFLASMGIPSMLTLWWILMGDVDQRISGLSTATSLETPKKTTPCRDPVGVWAG